MILRFILKTLTVGCKDHFSEGENKLIILANAFSFILVIAMFYWVAVALICYPELNANLILIGSAYNHHLLFIPAIVLALFMFKREERFYEYLICAISFIAFFYFEFIYSSDQAILIYSKRVGLLSVSPWRVHEGKNPNLENKQSFLFELDLFIKNFRDW
jgi:hypothetical protein